MLRGFERITKKNIPHKIEGRRSGDISVMYADVTRAEKELGWKAEYELNRMIEDAWRWQIKHPGGLKDRV
ncbi:UDP-glucose 4-epimerase [bioreactor metagenome]|uniref:UDP-glucose 4-epimerase n=1 Tax=bioreactor metagenome TaxID=1076179 RepID=A0A645GHN4_9ZZZZ